MYDVYMDTIRDLSMGKTNKFKKQFSRAESFDKDVPIDIVEDKVNGTVELTNITKAKL